MGTVFLIGLALFALGGVGAGAAIKGRDYEGRVTDVEGWGKGCIFVILIGLAMMCVTGYLYFHHHRAG